jgi:hypothetical protein
VAPIVESQERHHAVSAMYSVATPAQCLEIEGVCFMGEGETDHRTRTHGVVATIETLGLMLLTTCCGGRNGIFGSTS